MKTAEDAEVQPVEERAFRPASSAPFFLSFRGA